MTLEQVDKVIFDKYKIYLLPYYTDIGQFLIDIGKYENITDYEKIDHELLNSIIESTPGINKKGLYITIDKDEYWDYIKDLDVFGIKSNNDIIELHVGYEQFHPSVII